MLKSNIFSFTTLFVNILNYNMYYDVLHDTKYIHNYKYVKLGEATS